MMIPFPRFPLLICSHITFPLVFSPFYAVLLVLSHSPYSTQWGTTYSCLTFLQTDSSLSNKKESDSQQHNPSASYFRLHDAMNEANRNNIASKIVTMGKIKYCMAKIFASFRTDHPSLFLPPSFFFDLFFFRINLKLLCPARAGKIQMLTKLR